MKMLSIQLMQKVTWAHIIIKHYNSQMNDQLKIQQPQIMQDILDKI